MIKDDSLLKKLRSAFNLNIYEAKVWTALLSKGVATAGELSDMSNVPRSRSYDVLESLEKRGFVVMKLGRPIKYLAVAPEEILSRVKRDISERAQRDVAAIERLQDEEVFGELKTLFHQGIEQVDPSSVAGFFKSRSSAYDHIVSLLSNATSTAIISTTDAGLARKQSFLAPVLKRLKQSDVSVRIAAPLVSQAAKDAAKELSRYADVKAKDVGSRFVLVDSKDLLFMINSDENVVESTDVAIWANSPFFVASMQDMFEAIWK